jgi:hypothetical protein
MLRVLRMLCAAPLFVDSGILSSFPVMPWCPAMLRCDRAYGRPAP